MELSLILLALGFLGLVYLIFKFIKKAVFAVIAVVVVILLIFGGTIGLVYLDLNNLASQTDFDINVVLRDGDSYLLGASIPVVNQEPDLESISGITDLESLDPGDIKKSDNIFIVEIDDDFFETLLLDNYDLSEMMGDDLPEEFSEFDISLSKADVESLLDEGSDSSELVDLLLDKNGVEGVAKTFAEPVLGGLIDDFLDERNLDIRTTIFLAALASSFEDESNILTVIEAYKDDKVEITPDRLTFKMVRMLPASTIIEFAGLEE